MVTAAVTLTSCLKRQYPLGFSFSRKLARLYSSSSSATEAQVEQAIDEWTQRLKTFSHVDRDVFTPNIISAAQATLNAPGVEKELANCDPVPLAWHLFLFQPRFKLNELRNDGTEYSHIWPISPPAITGASERMWVSGKFEWNHQNPFKVGEEIEQVTTIDKVERKLDHERRGDMFFVWQNKQFSNSKGLGLAEKRCHVFRRPVQPGNSSSRKESPKPKFTKSQADFSSVWLPDSVLLFRYSALLFNSIRLHYDRDYCVNDEKRPDVVVHGPLVITKLSDAVQQHLLDNKVTGSKLKSIDYRATSPIYVNRPVHIFGKWIEGSLESGSGTINVWAQDEQGNVLNMDASAQVGKI